MKTAKMSIFLMFAVAVSICFGENELSPSSDSATGGTAEKLTFMPDTATGSSTETIKSTAKPEAFVKQDISTGTALSVAGGAVYTTGAVMTLTAIISLISASSYESAVSASKTGTIGTILMAVGPIPSCAGASIVTSSLKDNTTDAPIESYWGNYGTGWGLEVVSIAASSLANYLASGNDQTNVGVIVLAIAANAAGLVTFYEWGKAAWGSILYITRIRRMVETQKIHFALRPMYNIRGDAGMCLNVDF